MPRGDTSAYTDKQKRQAEHIEESYESRGVSEGEAERRAWATVNKETGGGKKSGIGRGKRVSHASSRKGGKAGRQSISHATQGLALGLRQNGGCHPQAQRSGLVIRHHLPRIGGTHKSLFWEWITSARARSDTGRRSTILLQFPPLQCLRLGRSGR